MREKVAMGGDLAAREVAGTLPVRWLAFGFVPANEPVQQCEAEGEPAKEKAAIARGLFGVTH